MIGCEFMSHKRDKHLTTSYIKVCYIRVHCIPINPMPVSMDRDNFYRISRKTFVNTNSSQFALLSCFSLLKSLLKLDSRHSGELENWRFSFFFFWWLFLYPFFSRLTIWDVLSHRITSSRGTSQPRSVDAKVLPPEPPPTTTLQERGHSTAAAASDWTPFL
jgi:hypothetical protein